MAKRTGRVFSGKPVSFKEAFPDIEEIKIETIEGSIGSSGDKRILTKQDLGDIRPCDSGVCENGGFELGDFISLMNFKKETFKEGSIRCKGYEKMGGKNKRDCPNYLNIKVEIKYKN